MASSEPGSRFAFLMGAGEPSLASSSSTTDSLALRLPFEVGVLLALFALAGARLRGVLGVVAALGVVPPALAPSPP